MLTARHLSASARRLALHRPLPQARAPVQAQVRRSTSATIQTSTNDDSAIDEAAKKGQMLQKGAKRDPELYVRLLQRKCVVSGCARAEEIRHYIGITSDYDGRFRAGRVVFRYVLPFCFSLLAYCPSPYLHLKLSSL